MQERAKNYMDEIRHHFGCRFFPEGAYAPVTPAELRKGDWNPLMHRAFTQMDLLCMAMKLHGLALHSWLKIVRDMQR